MLQKELREIERDKASGVTVQLNGSSLQRLTGYVEGVARVLRAAPCDSAVLGPLLQPQRLPLGSALQGQSTCCATLTLSQR